MSFLQLIGGTAPAGEDSTVTWQLSRWNDRDRAATVRLRRALNRGVGVLLLLPASFTLADVVDAGTGPAGRLIAAAVVLVSAALAARALTRWLGPAELVLLALATLATYSVPDVTGSRLHFSGDLMVFLFLLACVTTLRTAVLALFALPLLAASVLLQWEHTARPWSEPVDAAVLFLAGGLSASALVTSLARGSRRLERVGARVLATELENRMHHLQEDAESSVRRLLHDDVITALRAVVDLSPADPEGAREVAARAVESVGTLVDERREP